MDLLTVLEGPGIAMTNELSPREREILIMLANGHTTVTAARELGLTVQTVKNHLQRAYYKLHARNRQQAFLEMGWLSPPEIR
jgi:DNA-binding CsgD family transcriptional regulator